MGSAEFLGCLSFAVADTAVNGLDGFSNKMYLSYGERDRCPYSPPKCNSDRCYIGEISHVLILFSQTLFDDTTL